MDNNHCDIGITIKLKIRIYERKNECFFDLKKMINY